MGESGVEVTMIEYHASGDTDLKQIMKLLRRRRTRRPHKPNDVCEKLATSCHACKGPSIFHYLLPIIDLLASFNPRLSHYEDRILRRPRLQYAGISSNLPRDPGELWKWSEVKSQPCDCDECEPKSYLYAARSSHRTISLSEDGQSARDLVFYHERQSSRTKVQMTPKLYGDYEAMRLVRNHSAWLDHTYLQTPQKDAPKTVLRLRNQLDAWNVNMIGTDLRQTISRTQLLSLFDLFNQVFFRGAVPKHRASLSTGFSWLPETQKNCFGVGSYNAILGTQIILHPTLYRGQNQHAPNEAADLNIRWRNRLGTILHEMCHAFLKAYSCRACPSHDLCMGATGHGRAWQILAAKIEEVATVLLDGFIDLGRYPSMLSEMQKSGKLPSRHDLETYRFGTRWEHISCDPTASTTLKERGTSH